ncbi:hypothetical protein EXN66_Car005264 [Channa argus]|uniref:Uncharacterized protein n=1 Tax=Channa argus TaxID=215402 RepID=A0A6G1PH80_CHAAH|nr:hypothetical protein EXN66_Car005264 [Channa argus]
MQKVGVFVSDRHRYKYYENIMDMYSCVLHYCYSLQQYITAFLIISVEKLMWYNPNSNKVSLLSL